MTSEDFGIGFKSLPERIVGEREDRIINAKNQLSFGIKYLDISLGGIFKNDLIILGAKTGLGKTTAASIVAETNAIAGKRVHYFALEAEDREIERRLKYRLMHKAISRKDPNLAAGMSFFDWYMGKLETLCAPFESQVEEELRGSFSTLHTCYRSKDFDADMLAKNMLAVQNQTDLLVIDHLHYIDSSDPSENRGYKIIVKRIRDVSLSVGKPVIVIAHIRKSQQGRAPLLPSLEDFHGTSDVPKIATKAIMLAPAIDQENISSTLWKTYIHTAKCRFEGDRTRFVGLLSFNTETGRYEDRFQLGKLSPNLERWQEIMPIKYPSWCSVSNLETRKPGCDSVMNDW